eukprot:1195305-Prorocentrum_minimum.AAC.6
MSVWSPRLTCSSSGSSRERSTRRAPSCMACSAPPSSRYSVSTMSVYLLSARVLDSGTMAAKSSSCPLMI